MAVLRGGPGHGHRVPDDSRDTEYIACAPSDGGLVPILIRPPLIGAGVVETLPHEPSPEAEALLNRVDRRWECYQREYHGQPAWDDDLPAGPITYRWLPGRPPPR